MLFRSQSWTMNWQSSIKTRSQAAIREGDVMAFEKRFTNTVSDKKSQKREITRLTELMEGDENTIFSLIFVDIPKEKTEE